MDRLDGRMELLAPAGDMDALRAAVQNGADAVYLGAGAFNARRHAGNFDGDGLKMAVDYCHARNVHVHVTLNTLVRQDELEALYDTIRLINASGADAVIVQDFGVANAVRRMAPELELHASTQMAAHNVQAVRFLKDQGFDRVVLARECSFEDMAQCAAQDIAIEVFVHGALCTACSGQCLMSSMVGGRSGNRGLCAQPCRLPWRMDGREGYLLSTRDLCGIDDLARLRDAGVASLKIEGRLKRPEYVAVTVAAYRWALDALYAGQTIDTRAARGELAQMFNRGGFTRGYGPGVGERELMYPGQPNHMGVQVGASRKPGMFALQKDVLPDDVLAARGPDGDTPVRLSGTAGETVKCPRAAREDKLVRLVSAAQMAAARESFAGEHRRIPVICRATLRIGEPARLEVSDGIHAAEALGDVVQRAKNRGLDREYAARQLDKTGGTPYGFTEIVVDGDDDAFAPASMLNALRRDALEALTARRIARDLRTGPAPVVAIDGDDGIKPLLYAQSGDPEVLAQALACGADVAVYSPVDLRHLDAAALPERFALAVPAVLTAGALDNLNAWANANAGRITETFLSNVGHLGLNWPGRISGDYMLNAASDLTVARLAEWGVQTVTPSVELTARQIDNMGGPKNLIVWGRVPLMHLRHCPYRLTHDMGGRHADCGRCDALPGNTGLNGEALVDRRGAAFPLQRLAMQGGCVIQVLNSVPLMPLKKADRLPKASGWRLLLRPGEPVEALVKVYRAALDGDDFKALPEWGAIEAIDTTTGHFFRGVE